MRWAIVLVIALGPATSRADGLRASDAIRQAQALSPRTRSATHLASAAHARQTEARMGYIPTINAAAVVFTGFSGSSGSNLGVRGMMASPFVDHYGAGVEGSWSALEFLRIEPRAAAAAAEEAALVANRAIAERDVAIEIVEIYERILTVEARLEALEQDLASRKTQLAVLEAQVAGGTIAEVELLQSRAGLASVQAERTRVDALRQAARSTLVVLAGDPRYASAVLELDDLPRTSTEPETRVAVARREQAARQRSIATRELLPRLVVSGSVGYANPAAGKDTGYYAVGAAVVWPLTSFFGERAKQEAHAEAAEADADVADTTIQAREMEIAALRADRAGVAASIPAMEASEKAARASLDALDARGRAGAVRASEIEAARALVVDAQSNAAAVRVRVRSLHAKLQLLGDQQ